MFLKLIVPEDVKVSFLVFKGEFCTRRYLILKTIYRTFFTRVKLMYKDIKPSHRAATILESDIPRFNLQCYGVVKHLFKEKR